jgi:fibronectin-binding autotransporter adhesin
MTKHLRLTWFWLQEKKRLYFVGAFLVVAALVLIFQAQSAHGTAYTWDGGGSDGTCGGAAGDGNKWSCALNWSSDIVPTSSDTVTFDGTSTKNATITATVSVAGMTIASGYSGIITQSGANTLTVGASGYSQAAGTFTGGSGSISISTFALSGGTFTSTTGTMSISSSWTHTAGGTFTANGGLVSMTNTSGTAKTWDVATSETFYDFTSQFASGGGTSITIASGDTLIVTHTFTQSTGIVNTGTIEVQGSMVANSAAAANGSATVSFLVGGDQTITSTSGGTTNLNIAKSSGTLSVTGDLTIGAFTLTSGTFQSTTGTLTVGLGSVVANWTHTDGGTFTANGGTVSFGGTTGATIDVTTSETFYDVTFSQAASNAAKTIASGDTLVVAHTLTFGQGLINTGHIEAQGSVVISSANAATGTATLDFLVGTDQTITANAAGFLPNVNIAKSGGTVTASGTFSVTSLTQSAGGFDGGTGTITDSGNFTLSGGTFTSTSGTMTFTNAASGSGTWTYSGGSFVHNNGTISFTHGQGSYTIDVPSTITFYNLTTNVANNNRVTNITSGDTIIVLNALTQTTGVFNGGSIDFRGSTMTVGSSCGTSCVGSTNIYFGTSGDQTITNSGGSTSALVIDKPSGTVSISANNLVIYGLTMYRGTFTSTSGTLSLQGDNNTVGGPFTVTGGTFNHNNGTVSFIHGQGTSTINAPGGVQFNNLTINTGNSSRVLAISSGQTATVLGTFTQTNGTLNGPGKLLVAGSVVVGSSADGGNGELVFVGSADQTFNLLNGEANFDGDVTIDKGAGKVTLASSMTLDAASQDLTITNGTLDLGAASFVQTVSGSSGTLVIGTNGILQATTTGSLLLAVPVTNNGTIYLNANGATCGDADSIAVQSTVGGTQRAWGGTGKFVLADVAVRDQGGTATIVASSSTSTSGNGANWTFNSTCPSLVSSPNGSESWGVRTSQNITYSAYSGVDHYRLFYSTNSGAAWTEIGTTSSTTYAWTVPAINSTRTRILVQAENVSNTILGSDISDADFTIAATGTTLNGGIILNGGITF